MKLLSDGIAQCTLRQHGFRIVNVSLIYEIFYRLLKLYADCRGAEKLFHPRDTDDILIPIGLCCSFFADRNVICTNGMFTVHGQLTLTALTSDESESCCRSSLHYYCGTVGL